MTLDLDPNGAERKMTEATTDAQLKRYSVHVDGFDPYVYVAASASKARYRAYKAWREAGYGRRWPGHTSFGEFLGRVSCTLHLGSTP
jgi:hypothetical protein